MTADVISLRDMRFWAFHGVHPREREAANYFSVDVEFYLDLAAAAASDHLGSTIDYSQAYEVVRQVLLGEPRNLLETLAEEVAERLLDQFEVPKIGVRVAKLSPPLAGPVGRAEVRIERSGSTGDGGLQS